MESFLKKNGIKFENGKIKLKNSTKSVKIDIGLSYNAPHGNIWLKTQKNLEVFGFEPVPENIKNINEGAKKRHQSHSEPLDTKYIKNEDYHLIPCALSNKNEEEMDFYVTLNDTGCSSLFLPKKKYVGPVKEIVKVPVYTLKDFFDLFPWDIVPQIEYIKIDAQGSDLNILKGSEEYLKQKVIYVTAEPDGYQYDGAEYSVVQTISEYMEKNGFERVNHKNTKDPTFLNKRFLNKKDVFIKQE